MNRTQRNERIKALKKKYVYPVLICVLCCIALILLVDYRINSVSGVKNITIIEFFYKDKDKFTIRVFNDDFININTKYLKNDINLLKNRITKIKKHIYDSTVEAINYLKFIQRYHIYI